MIGFKDMMEQKIVEKFPLDDKWVPQLHIYDEEGTLRGKVSIGDFALMVVNATRHTMGEQQLGDQQLPL